MKRLELGNLWEPGCLGSFKLKPQIKREPLSIRMFEYLEKSLFFRKDRIKNLKIHIPKKTIKKNMGWCDDPGSKKYNRLIKFPFSEKAEKLFLKKKSYDLLLVISYNRRPIVPHKGSAIFLHIANKKFSPTKGCVAIKKKDFLKILPMIRKKTKIIIN